MILELCSGSLILGCIAAIVYLLKFNKPVKVEKKISEGMVHITVEAKRNIAKIEVTSGKKVHFLRKNIRGGDTVEFVYPLAEDHATLLIDLDNGKRLTIKL